MKFCYQGMSISALQIVLPENSKSFVDEMDLFQLPKHRSLKLAEVMGYEKHHIVEDGVTSSDLAIFGLQKLFDSEIIQREEIGALIVVSQSPDHFIPGTSAVIHGELRLSQDTYCLDINQGCAGYIVGLHEAFSLLQNSTITKVVLINVDVVSRLVSTGDRNSYPLIGDGAAITVVERKSNGSQHGIVKFDGQRREALIVHAGAFKEPLTESATQLFDDGQGNIRSRANLVMDGSSVFNFVQVEVPPLIQELIDFAKRDFKDIDYFAFHQPNRFMIEKLAQKMNVQNEKMPGNVVTNFGNSSGVTIPVNLAFNFRDQLLTERLLFCLAGFGVGLTWGGIVMEIGTLDYCEISYF